MAKQLGREVLVSPGLNARLAALRDQVSLDFQRNFPNAGKAWSITEAEAIRVIIGVALLRAAGLGALDQIQQAAVRANMPTYLPRSNDVDPRYWEEATTEPKAAKA